MYVLALQVKDRHIRQPPTCKNTARDCLPAGK